MAIPTTATVNKTAWPITTYQIYAPMIEIRWQSSDLPANTTSSSAGPTSSHGSSGAHTPTEGLSTGVKAAIGAAIAVVILAALAFGFRVHLQRRKRLRLGSEQDKLATPVVAHGYGGVDARPTELRGNALFEMEEQRRAQEVDSKDVSTHVRHELQGHD